MKINRTLLLAGIWVLGDAGVPAVTGEQARTRIGQLITPLNRTLAPRGQFNSMSLKEKRAHTKEVVVPSCTTGSPTARVVAPRKGSEGNIRFGKVPVMTTYPKNPIQDGRWPTMLTLANTAAKMQPQPLWN